MKYQSDKIVFNDGSAMASAVSFSNAILSYPTLAAAESAKVGMKEGQIVDIESTRNQYKLISGSLVLQRNLDQLAMDLSDESKGAAIVARSSISLDNISDLQNVIRNSSMRYLVASFRAGWAGTSRGPLGGGEFVWDASNSSTPIPGVVIPVSGVSQGRFRRVENGDFTILSCGADPFGIIDSTSAIQATYDYLRKTTPVRGVYAGEVKLPRGEYLVNGVINLSSLGGGYPRGVIFKGETGGGTIITRTNDSGIVFDIRIYLGLEFSDIHFMHLPSGPRAGWTNILFNLNGDGGGNRFRLTNIVTDNFSKIKNFTGTVGNQDTNSATDCQFNNFKTFAYIRGAGAAQAVVNDYQKCTWFGYVDRVFDIAGFGTTKVTSCNLVQSGDFLYIAAQGSGLASIFTLEDVRFEYWNGPAATNSNGTTRFIVLEDDPSTQAYISLNNCSASTRSDMDPTVYQFDLRGGVLKLKINGGTWSGTKIRTKGRSISGVNGWNIKLVDLINAPNPETGITREGHSANASGHIPISFMNCRNVSNITLRGPGNSFTSSKSAGTGEDRNHNTISGPVGYLLQASALNTTQTMPLLGYGSLQLVEKIRFFIQLSAVGSPTIELKAFKDSALTMQIGETLTVNSFSSPTMHEVIIPPNTFTTEGVFLTATNTVGATAVIFGLAYIDTLSC